MFSWCSPPAHEDHDDGLGHVTTHEIESSHEESDDDEDEETSQEEGCSLRKYALIYGTKTASAKQGNFLGFRQIVHRETENIVSPRFLD